MQVCGRGGSAEDGGGSVMHNLLELTLREFRFSASNSHFISVSDYFQVMYCKNITLYHLLARLS